MESQRTKIHWVTDDHALVGNALGYAHHNRMMRQYCEKYFEYDPTARIAIHIVPADKFVPLAGKFNILFTMWEALEVPDCYKPALEHADAVVVPCRFCKDIFTPYTKGKPVEVCWEGVEPNDFPFFQRTKPAGAEKFRFLWVGAPNPRKGYHAVLEATKIAEQVPNIEIYMKTTVQKIGRLEGIWKAIVNFKQIVRRPEADLGGLKYWWLAFRHAIERIPRPTLGDKVRVYGKHKNIVLDTRKLSFPDLVKLYNSAHCFILPSTGEGWGLTLCEAMATGAPSIAPCNTGTADFFDNSVGYVIKHDAVDVDFVNYKLKAKMFVPDTEDFLAKMIEVFGNYDEALKRGKKAHSRIHSTFTWERSAKRLDEIVRKVASNVS